jgi:curved DNA-binding protein CbpA
VELSKLMAIAAKIDQLDYYQLLGVSRDAPFVEIRRAYHRRARTIHPDRFFEFPDPEIRVSIDRIFKRIAEAYTILRDEDKRAHYNQGLNQDPPKLRFTDQDQQAIREDQKAASGRTAQGRKFYEKATKLYQKKQLKQAIQALRIAITFESENPHFQTLLSQWEAESAK